VCILEFVPLAFQIHLVYVGDIFGVGEVDVERVIFFGRRGSHGGRGRQRTQVGVPVVIQARLQTSIFVRTAKKYQDTYLTHGDYCHNDKE
jgi:hypothetical protein